MANVAGKMRKLDNPYASWRTRYGVEYRLLKSWQQDNGKDYARWFMAAKSAMTWGTWEMGDSYIDDCLTGYVDDSLSYDKSIWSNDLEFLTWAAGSRGLNDPGMTQLQYFTQE